MNIKIIPEILDDVLQCKTPEEVKAVLLKNQSPALKLMFHYVFDPRAIFTIKELPKYKPDPGPIGINPNSLFVEMRRLYVLLDSMKISLKKKTEILTMICESVHPSEAELLGKIIKKDLGIPLITVDLLKEIWPKG